MQVVKAVGLAKKERPDLLIEGPMQVPFNGSLSFDMCMCLTKKAQGHTNILSVMCIADVLPLQAFI